jgi:hypothetical protein
MPLVEPVDASEVWRRRMLGKDVPRKKLRKGFKQLARK